MNKRRRFHFFWWLFIFALLLAVLALWLGGLEVAQSKTYAENYEQALDCQTDPNCRIVVPGTVLFSREIRAYVTLPDKLGTRTRSGITSYGVRIKFTNSYLQDVKILPNISLDTTRFGVENVYLPVTQTISDKFAETSFPQGAVLKVEFWDARPTLIYTKYINPAAVSGLATEYAIPTANNPLVIYAMENSTFNQASVVAAVVFLLVAATKIFSKRK